MLALPSLWASLSLRFLSFSSASLPFFLLGGFLGVLIKVAVGSWDALTSAFFRLSLFHSCSILVNNHTYPFHDHKSVRPHDWQPKRYSKKVRVCEALVACNRSAYYFN